MVFDRRIRAALIALLFTFFGAVNAFALNDGAICTVADGVCPTKALMISDINEEDQALDNRAPMKLGSVSGTNTILASVTPTLAAYVDLQTFYLKPANDITGTATLNINGIGAKAVVSASGSALGSGDLIATNYYIVIYVAAPSDHFRVLTNLGSGGFASISAAFIMQANSGAFSAERAIAAGGGLEGTDGGANSTYTLRLSYTDTLAGNPAMAANGCVFSNTAAGGGLICEGSVADAFEGNFKVPDVTGADSTQTLLTNLTGVAGPASAIDNGISRFDGTSGRLIADSGAYIDDDGIITIGRATKSTNGDLQYTTLQDYGASTMVGGNHALIQSSNDASGAFVGLFKSRNATKGSHTVLQTLDDLGEISFHGSDGTNFVKSAIITPVVDGTPGSGVMPSRLSFWNMNAAGVLVENLRIAPSGEVFAGPAAVANNIRGGQNLAVVETGGVNAGGASLTTYAGTTAATAPTLDLQRSRGTTDGSMTIVAASDALGFIAFRGADGAAFIAAATIRATVDGTPGSNDMPGAIVFATTADGAASVTDRARITAAGELLVGTATATNNLRLGQRLGIVQTGGGVNGGMSFTNYAGTVASDAPLFDFQRSRGTTDGSFTAVVDADRVFTLMGRGADGTGWVDAASIRVFIDGTVGTNDMPGRISFWTTADGAASNTERMRITNAGIVQLLAGQLNFPAAQNASADPNTLDDFEEGTFTPGMTFNASATGVTFTTQTARYIKIGRLVICEIRIVLTSNGTGVGSARVTALPFTSDATYNSPSAPAYVTAGGSSASGIFALVEPSATTALLLIPGATTTAIATDTNVTDTFAVWIKITYMASA